MTTKSNTKPKLLKNDFVTVINESFNRMVIMNNTIDIWEVSTSIYLEKAILKNHTNQIIELKNDNWCRLITKELRTDIPIEHSIVYEIPNQETSNEIEQ